MNRARMRAGYGSLRGGALDRSQRAAGGEAHCDGAVPALVHERLRQMARVREALQETLDRSVLWALVKKVPPTLRAANKPLLRSA